MSDSPVENRVGYNPGWENYLIDMHLGMAEGSADAVLDATRTYWKERQPKRKLEIMNLLDMPADTEVHDLMAMQIWQLRGQD